MRAGRWIPLNAQFLAGVLLLAALVATQTAQARGAEPAGDRAQRFIVELRDPPLAQYAGRQVQARYQPEASGAGKVQGAGAGRLDLQAAGNRDYLEFIGTRHEDFRAEAGALLGRTIDAARRYRVAINGMAVDLTPAEAAALAASPQVKSITPDLRYRPQTDAGPEWIGAGELWTGDAGFLEARGENIVVGVIDTGANWEHPSFADPSIDGYVYSNPLGAPLGLCDDPEVGCNNKLIGVYDFVEDDPATEDVDEYTKGRDVDGHGSHVASIAVGNRMNILVNGSSANLSGVAPRANLVSYRVCSGTLFDSICLTSDILAAVDQAVADGVDVINQSLGSRDFAGSPWLDPLASAYLSARQTGIFVAASAGNSGPNPGTLSSPANAPWIIATGNATHDRVIALAFDLTGGPAGLACEEGNGPPLDEDIGPAPVVLADDVGDPFGCSTFPSGSMNGAIALLSRGNCLFATKVDNAAAAGADFLVVYNNVSGPPPLMDLGDSTIPSCAITEEQGTAARDFVQANPGATGRVNFPAVRLTNDAYGDILNPSSSRGPNAAPLQDIMKPNVIAPGTQILAASDEGQDFRPLSGTSMAAPHIAGAAALLKSVHSDWSPSQLASAIETTATADRATLDGLEAANPRERGAGRPQLGDAANAGLYLNVTATQFDLADPLSGGNPGGLNLPGLVEAECQGGCTFTRTVTDQMGGGNWTATALDFPDGVEVTISPSSFSLTNGGSRTLTVSVDLEQAGVIGEWVDGRIRLSAAGAPDQFLTVSAFSYGGDLPANWSITDDRNGGWREFGVAGLAGIVDATIQSGGLQPPERTVEVLPEDPTNDDPYDGGDGVFTLWYELPQGGLWLHAETLASTADDLDLYVGRDSNGNGEPDDFEELCGSVTPEDIESCDLYDLEPGDYWVLVQNFTGTSPGGDQATLLSAAIAAGDGSLAASGPGIVPAGEAFSLRLSWDNLAALPGEQWLGAVGIGTDRDHPNNIGVIPVRFNRSAISQPATFPLFDGQAHHLAVAAGGTHDRMFIDVPPGATGLMVSANAADSAQNNGLTLELRRLEFAGALSPPPFAAPPGGAAVVASASGGGGAGPAVTVSGASLQPGRWYAVLINGNGTAAAIEISAEIAAAGPPQAIHRGLWEPNSRPGLGQGYEYNRGGTDRALIWYTYDEDGQPTWYIAGSPEVQGNVWTSVLYRVTNDGERQQLAPVGFISVTTLAEDDAMFTWTLFGESGTERMQPLSPRTCPEVGGTERSYTGLWFRGVDGLGGASALISALTQAQIHYLFDGIGVPRWLVAQDLVSPEPTNEEMPMLQFTGYCAVCAATGVSFATVGLLERTFTDENNGSWTLDYLLEAPLSGSVQRTDQITKLTDALECQ